MYGTDCYHRRREGDSLSPSAACVVSHRRGSLLLEAVIAIGVFAIFLGGIGLSLVLAERTTIAAGDRTRGSFLAEQEIEAVRSMRLTNFTSVTTGIHGVVLTPTGWTFAGTGVTKNGYQTHVEVLNRGTDWIEVTAIASWNFQQTRSGSTALSTYLTNWKKSFTVGNWSAMTKIGELSVTGSPDFQKVAVSNGYAFVTGTNASGGKGLYVFDISNPTSPTRVASSFDLGAGAYGIAISGDYLYLASDDPTKEVQVYDISSPSTLVSGNLISSFDLPGSGKARSIAVYGDTIFVGSLDDPPNPQFWSIQLTAAGTMSLLGSLNMSGSVLDLTLSDGYAYAATSNNAGELEVVDIFDPAYPDFAPGIGMDLPDVQDGTAILTSGTAALIGRAQGSTIDEAVLYSVADTPVPSPPPGPWTLEVGGNVQSLATTYGSKYAFLASDTSGAQVKVLDMIKFERGESPVVKSVDAGASVRGLAYDWTKDRLYGVSPTALLVFAPGS